MKSKKGEDESLVQHHNNHSATSNFEFLLDSTGQQDKTSSILSISQITDERKVMAR